MLYLRIMRIIRLILGLALIYALAKFSVSTAQASSPPTPSIPSSDYLVGAYFFPAWNLDETSPTSLYYGWTTIQPFPLRRPYLGYYDDQNPEVWDWQIKWASENGINFFIFDWARCGGFGKSNCATNLGKPVIAENIPSYPTVHKGLFNSKYKEKIKFALMLTDDYPTTQEFSDPNDFSNNFAPFLINTYFKKPNYLVIDNKPILFIYDNAQGYAKWSAVIPTFRQMVKNAGFADIILAGNDFGFAAHNYSGVQLLKNSGFDYVSTYVTLLKQVDGQTISNKPTEDQAMRSQVQTYQDLAKNQHIPFIVTASPFWDSYPLSYNLEEMRYYLTPDNFKSLINLLKNQMAQSNGPIGKKMIIVDAWNEFAEGHYLAPNDRNGFGYLQAVREALTKKDNTPDYTKPVSVTAYESLYRAYETKHMRKYAEVKTGQYSFNNQLDFIDIIDLGYNLQSAGVLSYGGWLKSGLTTISTPFGKTGSATVTIGPNGGGFCEIATNTNGTVKSAVAGWGAGKLQPNAWAHLFCIYDGNNLSAYINKVKVSSVSAGPGPIAISPNRTTMGYYVDPSRWTTMAMSGFRFENTAFSDAQITELFNTTKPGTTVVPGDLNNSGHIDIFDYSSFVADYGKTGTPGFVPADINKDGKVDALDYNTLLLNFGK